MNSRPQIGLALGGGGARGIAHIGVLKVLEQEKIPIDLIVGTSIGALMGGAYALNPDAQALEKRLTEVLDQIQKGKAGLMRLGRAHRYNNSKSEFIRRIVHIAQKEMFLNMALFRSALLSADELRECVETFLGDTEFKSTKIPFGAVAVDLISGEQLVIRHGSMVRAVMASTAVPGFMPAVSWENKVLVDGCTVSTIPSIEARKHGADVVIGVDVGSSFSRTCTIEDGIDSMNRAMEIMNFHLRQKDRDNPDVLIEPAVNNIEWTNVCNFQELIHLGESAARSKIEEIKKISDLPLRKKVVFWPITLTFID